MRKIIKTVKGTAAAILAAVMLIGMCACGENTDKPGETANNTVFGNEENGGATQPPANTDTSSLPNVSASDKFSGFDTTISYDRSKAVSVELKDGGSSANGAGVTVDGNTVTIRAGGTYILSGKLTDGQIVVSVEKTEKVQLVLENVEVTNSSSAAIYVTSADKVAITLTEGSTNKFTDGSTYSGQNEKGEPNACIFSKDDLTINGYGTLIVKGNYNNGISTTNDLKIVSGVIEVSAKNNALKGKDSFLVNSGKITVNSDDDGIKVSETDDPAKGFICIEGGEIIITAGDDALQAVTGITVSGGKVTAYAGGKSINCDVNVNIADGCLIEK